jgi:DNA-binding CsgD family transcriptional regulator
MDPETEQRVRFALIGAVVLLGLNGVINLLLDLYARGHPLHLAIEVTTTVAGMGAAAALGVAWLHARRGEAEARRALLAGKAERDAWRDSARKALEGLGSAIDSRFREWGLTPTEREVALLLMKGHSHKHIASLTGRRERTVRQHSVVIYQKAGLSGRSGLAAFFLEDLMLPDQAREAIQVGGDGHPAPDSPHPPDPPSARG